MLRGLREIDGRWLTALMIVAYFGFLVFGWSVLHVQLWSLLGVPTLPRPFHDLNDIAIGIDRFNSSPHPWSRESILYSTGAYNYTQWWLCATWVGLSLKTVPAFALGLIGLFFFSALFVLGRLTLLEGLFSGLVLISPNVMTAVERANADLFIFALIVLSVALRRSVPLSAASITAAALLKIYPVVALFALIRPPWRKTVLWAGMGCVLATINVLTSLPEIQQITTNVTRIGWFSYGSTTIMEGYWKTIAPGSASPYWELFVVGTLLFLFVVGWSVRLRPQVKVRLEWERSLFIFRLGATLYLGTFAWGSNLDHRTIILILCLPFLFILRKKEGGISLWASTAIFGILFYTYARLLVNDEISFFFYLKQLIAWLMVFLFAGIYAGSFPWSEIGKNSMKANI